ncbi:hypothetical protein [Lunatibacter salilacus]|uniref:hypothetical protein n=1 Tax=Lunatibacter salilacus TaxID=2483804 RepID=UPI00131A7646|nr:hypothetical protein [Lunatibacter salilacus]
MNEFNFKKRNLVSGPHILGPLLIVAGLVALVSTVIFNNDDTLVRTLLVGGGAIVLGLIIINSYEGTLIDLRNKRIKTYISIVGYKLGEWKALANISTVKVITNSYIRTNVPNGISPTFSGKVTDFKTLLYSDEANPVLTFVYSKKKKAIKQATRLASNLNAKLIFDL